MFNILYWPETAKVLQNKFIIVKILVLLYNVVNLMYGGVVMKCFNHPEKDVQGSCVYCGKLFCEECLVDVNGKMYCKSDIGKVMKETKEEAAATRMASPAININTVNTNQHQYCRGSSLSLQKQNGCCLVMFLPWRSGYPQVLRRQNRHWSNMAAHIRAMWSRRSRRFYCYPDRWFQG